MNQQGIQAKIEQAKQLVGGDPNDPLTRIAFEVVFRKLLGEPESQRAERAVLSALPKLEINEVLASTNLKSHMDKVEAIAWYFLQQGENSVSAKDISDAYRKARLQKPKNFSDVIAKCAKRGHLGEAGEKKDDQKAWHLTSTLGEPYIKELVQLGQR